MYFSFINFPKRDYFNFHEMMGNRTVLVCRYIHFICYYYVVT